jgi:purine-binding chemotaxis protein CheW
MQSGNKQSGSGKGGKYLTFGLAGEEYGIDVMKVKEIIGLMPITTVPRTPNYVLGVINLRGKVIPVIDLRLRFGMESVEFTDRTCVIVVEISSPSGPIMVGVVVDKVSDVLNIKDEDIEEKLGFGTSLDTEYISGLAKMENGVKILVDIDNILSSGELSLIERVA